MSPLLALLGGATTLMVAMGIGRFLYTPILPDMIAVRLLDVASAGLLASSNFLGYFVGALGAAFFANPRARRAVLIAAIALSVLTTLAMGLTQQALLWHLLRLLWRLLRLLWRGSLRLLRRMRLRRMWLRCCLRGVGTLRCCGHNCWARLWPSTHRHGTP